MCKSLGEENIIIGAIVLKLGEYLKHGSCNPAVTYQSGARVSHLTLHCTHVGVINSVSSGVSSVCSFSLVMENAFFRIFYNVSMSDDYITCICKSCIQYYIMAPM